MKIFIPFKEKSIRYPDKNFELFPIVYDWLFGQNTDFNDVYAIADTQKVKDFLKNYDIKVIDEKDLSDNRSDTLAAFNAAKEFSPDDWFVLLPLTQPVRENNIMLKLLNNISDDASFITTFQYMTDRSIFEIDDNSKFIIDSEHHTGSMCKTKKILDGSIYLINPKFIDTILNSKDVNKDFWHSNFKAVEHNVLFCDIDTKEDMTAYENTKNL